MVLQSRYIDLHFYSQCIRALIALYFPQCLYCQISKTFPHFRMWNGISFKFIFCWLLVRLSIFPVYWPFAFPLLWATYPELLPIFCWVAYCFVKILLIFESLVSYIKFQVSSSWSGNLFTMLIELLVYKRYANIVRLTVFSFVIYPFCSCLRILYPEKIRTDSYMFSSEISKLCFLHLDL